MDFGKAFTYPFQDPDWAKKILIPAAVMLIPIIGQIVVLGWSLEIVRRVIRQDPNPLPELDFGKNLSDGFKGFVINLVYAIPMIIFSLPPSLAPMLLSSGEDTDIMGIAATLIMVCCYGLMTLYGLLLAVVMPAALANFVAHENMSAGFRFKEVFGLIRVAIGPYLIVLVGVILSGMIAGLGSIACAIGIVATSAYAMAINGHLYGQAYNEATQNLGLSSNTY